MDPHTNLHYLLRQVESADLLNALSVETCSLNNVADA